VNAQIKKQGRQGDLLFRKVAALPKDAKEVNDNVLARGEITGHTHRIEGAKVFRSRNQLLVQVDQVARVVHEEHEAFELSTGIYEVVRQREYTPDATRLISD
jgi:hypothetical protein